MVSQLTLSVRSQGLFKLKLQLYDSIVFFLRPSILFGILWITRPLVLRWTIGKTEVVLVYQVSTVCWSPTGMFVMCDTKSMETKVLGRL